MKIANNSRYHTDDLQRIVDHILNNLVAKPAQLGWGLARFHKTPDEVTLVFAEHTSARQTRWRDGKNDRSYVRRMTYAQAHRVLLLAPELVVENKIAALTQPLDSDGYCAAPEELVEELVENLMNRLDCGFRSGSRATTVKQDFSQPVYRLRYRYGSKPKGNPAATEADRLVVRKRMHSEARYRARQALHAIDKMRAAMHSYNVKQRAGDVPTAHMDALNTIREELETVERVLELVREK